jgi:hypothetical protein
VDSQQLINILFTLCSVLFGIVMAVIGWWVKGIDKDVKDQQRELSEFKVDLAKGYVPRSELQATFERIFDTLDAMHRELAHISRNQTSVQSMRDMIKHQQERP